MAAYGCRLNRMTYKLVLLRHGQSAWNKTNQFTGWVDVPLTEQGEAEAKRGGELEAECLANVVERVKPYFESAIEPELRAGKTVLIAAHGNSLRAIVKMLDNLSEDEIAKVNIPTAIPLLYELDENFKPIKPRGEYLDPEAAAAGAAAVAAQGQK